MSHLGVRKTMSILDENHHQMSSSNLAYLYGRKHPFCLRIETFNKIESKCS